MKIDSKTGLPVLELNEIEESLDRIEESWADCAAGFRPDSIYRRSRLGGRLSIRGLGLIVVHELLEDLRMDFEGGDSSALYDVLKLCLAENLPLPYWASEGLLRAMNRVDKTPALSMHTALGLDERYPLTEKRARATRHDWQAALELWGLVQAHPKYRTAPTTAVREVLKSNRHLPFSPRKADEMFKMVDRIQARAINTIHRSK